MVAFLRRRRVWTSLSTMTVVASLAIAGTNAFFNDVETASGNTFTTGGIDLKVDSQSHYNGLTCENGVWVNHCDANSGANLLVNGDFETPIVTICICGIYIRTARSGWAGPSLGNRPPPPTIPFLARTRPSRNCIAG